MSVNLEDARGQTLRVNAWNWGVLHYAIACATPPIFTDQDFLDHLRAGCGATLSAEEIETLYQYLSREIVPQLQAGQRMRADLSVTVEPDDGTFHHDDLTKNYSLKYEVLLSIVQFLETAQSPIEVW